MRKSHELWKITMFVMWKLLRFFNFANFGDEILPVASFE